MSWFKRKQSVDKLPDTIGRTLLNQVKCETCKHWIDKEDAQNISNFWYYCPMHKKPYDKITLVDNLDTGRTEYIYYKHIPAHYIEVTEEGEPVKGKKGK